MLCKECQDHLVDIGKRGALSTELERDIETHLDECAECSAHFRAAQAMRDAARQWQDVAAPVWQRVPAVLHHPARVRPWLNWLPLTAAIVLLCFVLLRLQVQWTKDGVVVTFGRSEQAGVSEHQLDALRADLNRQIVANNEAQERRLRDAALDLDSRRREDMIALMSEITDLYNRDNQALVSVLQDHTLALTALGDRTDVLAQAQEKNRDSLAWIARQMDTQPRRR